MTSRDFDIEAWSPTADSMVAHIEAKMGTWMGSGDRDLVESIARAVDAGMSPCALESFVRACLSDIGPVMAN